MTEIFNAVIEKNPALAELCNMDSESLKIFASALADVLTKPKEDEEQEHGEFFLLKWEDRGDKVGYIPDIKGRFLSRTAALDVAKIMNQGGIAAIEEGIHYDVASVSWLVRYAELVGQSNETVDIHKE